MRKISQWFCFSLGPINPMVPIFQKKMSFIKIWLHYIWATKHRKPMLKEPYRSQLFEHIKQHAIEKNIYLDRINGYYDHVHAIVSLGSNQTIDGIAQLLKGKSSFWFNNRSGFPCRLTWAG